MLLIDPQCIGLNVSSTHFSPSRLHLRVLFSIESFLILRRKLLCNSFSSNAAVPNLPHVSHGICDWTRRSCLLFLKNKNSARWLLYGLNLIRPFACSPTHFNPACTHKPTNISYQKISYTQDNDILHHLHFNCRCDNNFSMCHNCIRH